MVATIQIIGQEKVRNMLTGFTRTLPEGMQIGTRQLAKRGVAIVKRQAKIAGLRHWGGGQKQLLASAKTDESPGFTRFKQRGNIYEISLPRHGPILDKGNYFTILKRGRLVTKWARDRNLIPGKFKVGGIMFVKPHRFIAPSVTAIVRLAQTKTRKNPVRKEIHKRVNRKGR